MQEFKCIICGNIFEIDGLYYYEGDDICDTCLKFVINDLDQD